MTNATTIDPAEIEKFSRIADTWWDPNGKFRPLHRFNPARLGYIKHAACAHFGRDPEGGKPLAGLRLLDIGCGGGLVSEPMARLGAAVSGVDASERNVGVARLHAAGAGLAIDYRVATVEALVAEGETPFDIVLNLEVVEHVADVGLFLKESAALLKPGGLMVIATLNRTMRAFLLAKVGAEYVLGWLPRGAHDPRKFIRPKELSAALERAGLTVTGTAGVVYNPLLDRWSVSADDRVNYMQTAIRA